VKPQKTVPGSVAIATAQKGCRLSFFMKPVREGHTFVCLTCHQDAPFIEEHNGRNPLSGCSKCHVFNHGSHLRGKFFE
jgi:hypothetical protein